MNTKKNYFEMPRLERLVFSIDGLRARVMIRSKERHNVNLVKNKHGIVSSIGRKLEFSDSCDFDSVALTIPFATLLFGFHWSLLALLRLYSDFAKVKNKLKELFVPLVTSQIISGKDHGSNSNSGLLFSSQ